MIDPEFVWFVIAMPLLWPTVALVSAYTNGWSSLAKEFRTQAPAPPEVETVTGKMGWVSYNGILTVGHSAEGLYVRVLLPFRLFHPTLLIPWNAITARKRTSSWLGSNDVLDIRDATLSLPVALTKKFENLLPPAK